eukprot:g22858.t1
MIVLGSCCALIPHCCRAVPRGLRRLSADGLSFYSVSESDLCETFCPLPSPTHSLLRDSSDSGKVQLWLSALESMKTRRDKAKRERKELRALLKQRIRAALYEDLGVTREKEAALKATLHRDMPGEAVRKRRKPSRQEAPGFHRDK